MPRAYGHFSKNGKFGNRKENRKELTGAITQILDNPLFITKDKQGTLYFYKPFKSKVNGESEILDIISVSVEQSGKIEYRTTYKDTRNQTLSLLDGFEVVYKAK